MSKCEREPVTSVGLVKEHLNIVDSSYGYHPDDYLLAAKTLAAEAYISRWLAVPLAEMDEVPDDLTQAVLMLVAHWYENRETSLVGITAQEVPFGVREIIDQHRAWSF